MKRAVITGAVAACLGMVTVLAAAPGAHAESASVPAPTSRATADADPAHRTSVHVSIGVNLPSPHHVIVPPEIHGGTIYLPNISAGPIGLPTIKGGTVTLPDVKGGTVTLPDISGRPIVAPKIDGGTVSIPPIVFPSMRASGNIQVNGTNSGNGHGNFLAAGGMGAPATRPTALPKTGV